MAIERFEEHRDLLTAVAYRVLGTVTDAEDVVQEAWLRWSGVDTAEVEDDRAYLIRVTTRLSIDRLRRVKARRESYVGPWLPELVGAVPDVAEHAELTASIELALLVVLETLSPLERAVFVLREAFALPYAEIGEIIGRTEATARQLARRAKQHVRERRPRFEVDRAERRRLTERFVGAASDGDLDALTAMLAHDVSLVGDGGGKAKAPVRVITGCEKVARFLLSAASARGVRKFLESLGTGPTPDIETAVADVNGAPAAVVTAGGRPVSVFSLVIQDGLIQTVFLVANPEKMSRL
ncbi:RNA polymerase sigma factor SigJ [Streptosporangium roseum]|uniref:RNA polymerase, sigma-24 subunit, ECF subfamily n=1 Tax=Streptosporangium roseum (strain ATCC 12428 / DSM 43021 / JCM 3005 / KCTC 9067 / NCIMB 10171 / NRRL 2505 / NI 9100) TaxID=479432 RepID=D2BCA4_STRRD|nr:RNA polymerase sigma factor SigJ [Streptosporangium roseum]ACZ89933.1 RNA polymerase, sigma-24 subunit, ECF subfamily [Streptosporangium roseum DSM 43021]